MPRSKWKRFEFESRKRCACCGCRIEPGEVCVSREAGGPLYCSTGCGVINERIERLQALRDQLRGDAR